NHTARTLEALRRNDLAAQSDLVIFSDGARGKADERNVRAVRELAFRTTGFRSVTVVERERNFGLGTNIIEGVTEMCAKHGRVGVLEDDLVTAPYFLRYRNGGLTGYENECRVASVHGYLLPLKVPLPETSFLRGADCWGWATWK